MKLSILEISMRDRLGGAEKVTYDLLRGYRRREHDARMVVGQKRTDDPDVLLMPNDRADSAWSRLWWGVYHALQPGYGRFPGSRLLCKAAHRLAQPAGLRDVLAGVEDFHFPGSWKLLDLGPRRPDIVHAHNLHSNYFDLRALPWLSRQVPVVLSLHDTWLLSGHCAYSLGCDRWKTGCGACPDLTLHPAVRRDATDLNWRRKRNIFAQSRVYVASSARWVLDRVSQSILAPAVIESRVIPYGIDLDVFKPGDRRAARAALGLPVEGPILLFAANGIRRNAYKDFATLRSAIDIIGRRFGGAGGCPIPLPYSTRDGGRGRTGSGEVTLVALGEKAPPQRSGACEIRFVPFENDPAAVARYYQAADVYVHAAKAEVTPLAIIEALACGVPVVATAVGGVPEMIHSLRVEGVAPVPGARGCDASEATGVLTPPGDAESLARGVLALLGDAGLSHRLGENAVHDAAARFGIEREVDDYLDWFTEILAAQGESERVDARPVSPEGARPLQAITIAGRGMTRSLGAAE